MQIDRRTMLSGMTGATMATTIPSALAAPAKGFFERIKRPIGLQLYTMGEEPAKDLDGVLARLATIGYRDIELPGLLGKSAVELRAAADRAGVRFSCIHLSTLSFGGPGFGFNSSAQEIADTLGTLGIADGVMPLPPLPDDFRIQDGESIPAAMGRALSMTGIDGWKRTAALLNAKAAALSPHGITLGFHNHNVEFARVGGTTGWDILVKETDANLVQFEVDLGWVAAAGMDPAAFLLRHAGRVRWVHVKDIKASTKANVTLQMDPSEIGAGKLNWSRILPAAHKAGVHHFYVEQEPPFAIPRIEAVERSFAYLSKLV